LSKRFCHFRLMVGAFGLALLYLESYWPVSVARSAPIPAMWASPVVGFLWFWFWLQAGLASLESFQVN